MKKILILHLVAIFLLSACSSAEVNEEPFGNIENNEAQQMNEDQMNENQQNNQTQNNEDQQNSDDQNDDKKCTETDHKQTMTKLYAKQVLEEYKNTFLEVVENADEQGKVKDLHSKSELISEFTTIMSQDLATWYADTYFQEKNNHLYVKAIDGPTWFEQDKSFELEKVNVKQYKVIQERNNELLGHIHMIFVLSYEGENWIVQELQQEELDSNNE